MAKIDYKTKIDHVHNVYLCNLSKFELPWLELIMMFDILIVHSGFLLNSSGINFHFSFLHSFIHFCNVYHRNINLGGFSFVYFIDDIYQ